MEKIYDVGVIVGRFQSDNLTKGHLTLIKETLMKCNQLIIVLGVSPLKCSFNDPLDYQTRVNMIKEYVFTDLTDYEILFLPIKDVKNDEIWNKNLDKLITDTVSLKQSVAFFGSRYSFLDTYTGKYPTVLIEETKDICASDRREEIASSFITKDKQRYGVIWASRNRFINAVPCVDIAVLNEDNTMVLLGKRNSEKGYRFIGGHVDAGETYEQAAIRETKEETNIDIYNPRYICSDVINDWRHKTEPTKLTTAFFRANISKKEFEDIQKANDDIDNLCWFYFIDTNKDMFEKSHQKLYNELLKTI